MDEPKKEPTVFVNDEVLAEQIRLMLAAGDIHVEKNVIRLIMQYQTNNYENLGIIRIKYQ